MTRKIIAFVLSLLTAIAVITTALPSQADAKGHGNRPNTQSSNPTWE